MMNPSADSGIPLLTEILVTAPEVAIAAVEVETMPSLDFDIPDFLTIPVTPARVDERPVLIEEAHVAAPIVPAAAIFAPVTPPPLPQLSKYDWERMEAEIGERITRQVLGRVDFVLEQRVRDSLADVLQVAVEGLAQEIKRGLHQTVEEVIARAVAQEITRLQITKF